MKKTIITLLAVATLVAVFGGVGTAYAMEDAGKGPGNGGNGTGTAAAGANGTSILSPYMTDAVASALNLDPADVADRLAAGETFYDIIISMGYTAEFAPEFIANLQATATEAAAADGLVPQTQLNTNLGTQSQLNDGTCDGTGDYTTNNPVPNLDNGTNSGTRGYRGGR